MNILITGGAGFIGSELGKFLVNMGHNVKILDNLEYGYIDNFSDNEILKNNFIQADIREANFEKYLDDINIIYHFAGISSLPECEFNPYKAFDVNTSGVANVLSACRKSNVQKFIFASTSAVYENNCSQDCHKETDTVSPNLIYATSKYCAEQICASYAQNYDMNIIICRFFNVFGPHQDFKRKYPPFTSYIIKEALSHNTPTIYNTADCKRDYIYIDDLIQYLHKMLLSNKTYCAEIFNLASSQAYSAIEIAQTVYQILNQQFVFNTNLPDNFWNKYTELFDKNFNLNQSRVKQEVFKHCLADNSKIINEFNYIPKTSLKDGLSKIIGYQNQHKG